MDAPTTLAFHSIAQSNLPGEKKTAIRRFFERVTGSALTPEVHKAVSVAAEGGQLIRQDGEALIVGGLLGLADAEGKLDVGKDDKIPIDGVVAGLTAGAALLTAGHPLGLSTDLRNVSSIALGILTFRKTKKWREEKKGSAGLSSVTPSAHGDPILAMGKDFGIE